MRNDANAYRTARQMCGLSIEEAAEFHGVDVFEVAAWDEGERQSTRAAWEDLCSLFAQIQDAANVEAVRLASREISSSFYTICPEADRAFDPLPFEGARKCAGVMALMGAITLRKAERNSMGLGWVQRFKALS